MRRGLIGLVVAMTLLVGACGSDDDTLSESEIKDVLVQQGLDDELADCVAEKIGGVSEDEAIERAGDAGFECATEGIGVPDISVPDISIPDISIPDISIDLGE